MNKKINIAEIARRAGVSTATVSYVVNDVGRVSASTRAKVKEIINELDYTPSLNAKSLSNGRTKLIGVTLPLIAPSDTTGSLLETNPFYAEYLGEIHKVISSYGYDILLSGIRVKGKYKNWIKSRGLDGIIFLGSYPQDIYDEVKELGIPTVLTDIYESYTENFHTVNSDDPEGSYLATKHLIDLGHRKIGFVGGDIKRSPVHNNRFVGYGRAMSEAELKINNDCVFETLTTFEGGIKVAKKIIDYHSELTGLVVDADIVALGIMKTFQDAGKKIPDDMSIVGFDDIQSSSFVYPGLTTIRQFISKKGETAANLIMKDILADERTAKSETIKSKLIIRGSTQKVI